MKPLVRTLLVWLLLLALPYQGLASAAMLPCAHAHGQVETHMPPCHEQARPAPHASVDACKSTHATHGAAAKCGSCGACCAVAAMLPVLPAAPALAPPQFDPIPFHAAHLPSVDPVLPERPPSISLA